MAPNESGAVCWAAVVPVRAVMSMLSYLRSSGSLRRELPVVGSPRTYRSIKATTCRKLTVGRHCNASDPTQCAPAGWKPAVRCSSRKVYIAIEATAEHQPSVHGKRHSPHRPGVPRQGGKRSALAGVPETHPSIEAAASQPDGSRLLVRRLRVQCREQDGSRRSDSCRDSQPGEIPSARPAARSPASSTSAWRTSKAATWSACVSPPASVFRRLRSEGDRAYLD
jgi:hypothetical protein